MLDPITQCSYDALLSASGMAVNVSDTSVDPVAASPPCWKMKVTHFHTRRSIYYGEDHPLTSIVLESSQL